MIGRKKLIHDVFVHMLNGGGFINGRQCIRDIHGHGTCAFTEYGHSVDVSRFVIFITCRSRFFTEPVIKLAIGQVDIKQIVSNIPALTKVIIVISNVTGQSRIGAVGPGGAVEHKRTAVIVAADHRAGVRVCVYSYAWCKVNLKVLNNALRVHVNLTEPCIAFGQFIGDVDRDCTVTIIT